MKYSVIIPIYNSEKTLDRCLGSLAAEGCPDAEFLLIDDGSTDSSAAICQVFAHRDSRFRLIRKENGGVSSARNLGLRQARGEFILFVDSDDYVLPGYFAALDAADPEDRWDYLHFSYRRSNGTQRQLTPFASDDPALFGPVLAQAYQTKWLYSSWNKRFRRSILTEAGIRYHESLSIAEDMLFNLQYLTRCRSVCMLDTLLYCVSLENTDSLSRRLRSDRRELLALANREAEQTILSAPISEDLRVQLLRARNYLLLRDIYAEAKQFHRAHTPLPQRWGTLYDLCRDFFRPRPELPRDLRCRILALPVRLRLVPVIDLMGKKLAK